MKLYSKFASYYDGLYWRKNYGLEADFVLAQFERVFGRKAESVVDFGCGTGKHVEVFVERGLNAKGMDSSDEMLEIARTRKGDFSKGNFVQDKLGEGFDLATCLFSTLQHADKRDLPAAIKNFHGHLDEGLCFVDAHNTNSSMTFVNTFMDKERKIAKMSTWRVVSGDSMRRETAWLTEDGLDVSEMFLSRLLPGELQEMAEDAGFDKTVFFGGWSGQPMSTGDRFIAMMVKR